MRNPIFMISLAIAGTLSFLAFLVWSGPTGTPAPKVVEPAPVVAVTPPAAGVPLVPVAAQTELLLTSAPSGARVYLDGKDTGLVTPTQLTVPSQGFSLMIIKKGYRPYVDSSVLGKVKGRKFHVALARKPRK